jgi:hypothetical protein
MSTDAQAIYWIIGFILFVIAAISPLRTPAERATWWWAIHTGWLGLAVVSFMFFWIAVKAS